MRVGSVGPLGLARSRASGVLGGQSSAPQFILDEQFAVADTAALLAHLSNPAGPYDQDLSRVAEGLVTLDPLVQYKAHATAKVPLLDSNLYLFTKAFPLARQTGGVWVGWAIRYPNTMPVASGVFHGADVGLYEGTANNQGVYPGEFRLDDSGEATVIVASMDQYGWNTNNSVAIGGAASTIPLATLRDGNFHRFASLVESVFNATTKTSALRVRTWHLVGAAWVLMTDMNLANVLPDSIEAWRRCELSFSRWTAEADFVHVGELQIEDARRTQDPFGVGVVPVSCSVAPAGASRNLPVDYVVTDVVIDANNEVGAIVVTSAPNQIGLNLLPYMAAPGDGFFSAVTSAPDVVRADPTTNRHVVPQRNGSGTLSLVRDGVTAECAVTVTNQTGHIGDDFTGYADAAAFQARYDALGWARDGASYDVVDPVDGHPTIVGVLASNPTYYTATLIPQFSGRTDVNVLSNDLWIRARVQMNGAAPGGADGIYLQLITNRNLLCRTTLVVADTGSNISDGVNAPTAIPALDYAAAFDDALPHDLVIRQTYNVGTGKSTMSVWLDGALLVTTAPADLPGRLEADFAIGTFRLQSGGVTPLLVQWDAWLGELVPDPLGLL